MNCTINNKIVAPMNDVQHKQFNQQSINIILNTTYYCAIITVF